MNKRVLLALVALLGLWSGCKKEPPDVTEAQAYSVSEKELEKICGGAEGGGRCSDFLYMGVFPPEDKARFKWAFHYLAQQLSPMNLVIVEVSAKGEPATMMQKLAVGSDLSKYKLKGSALALTGAQVPSGSAMAGKSPEQAPAAKPAEAGKPGEATAAAAKPGEPRPGEARSAEAKQGAPKPAEAAAQAAKPAEKPAPPPPPKPAAPPAPAVTPSTKTAGTPTTIDELYPAGALRNPFVKVEGGKEGAATLAGSIPEGEFSIHGLALKGLMDDRGDGIAILVDPKYGASFVFRRGKLYDSKNKAVPGVRGAVKVKQRTVVLRDESGEEASITMAEPGEAAGSGASDSGSPFAAPGSSGSSGAPAPSAPAGAAASAPAAAAAAPVAVPAGGPAPAR